MIMVGRDTKRLAQVQESMRELLPEAAVSWVRADLMDPESVAQ